MDLVTTLILASDSEEKVSSTVQNASQLDTAAICAIGFFVIATTVAFLLSKYDKS